MAHLEPLISTAPLALRAALRCLTSWAQTLWKPPTRHGTGATLLTSLPSSRLLTARSPWAVDPERRVKMLDNKITRRIHRAWLRTTLGQRDDYRLQQDLNPTYHSISESLSRGVPWSVAWWRHIQTTNPQPLSSTSLSLRSSNMKHVPNCLSQFSASPFLQITHTVM